MKRTLLLLVLLVTSQFSYAITKSEQECITKVVYHEARSLKEKDWLKVANVTYNRSKHFKEYHFGAKSKHLCDIVKSKQYTSKRKLKDKIKEKKRYEEIKKSLLTKNWKTKTNALYFTTRNGRMIYSKEWRG